MDKQFSQRTRVLIGDAGMDRLERASVALFGVGGVGSYAAEALVRAGVGHLSLIDFDHVRASNLNRQLPATTATLGQLKVAAMGERLKLINPELCLTLHPLRFQRRLADDFLADGYDFVIDAIDSLSAKVNLIQECLDRGLPLVSSMGSGSKLRSEMVRVGDLFEVVGCPLARLVRKRLRRRAINRGVPVIYSTELPILCGRSAGGGRGRADRQRPNRRDGRAGGAWHRVLHAGPVRIALRRLCRATTTCRHVLRPPRRNAADRLLA